MELVLELLPLSWLVDELIELAKMSQIFSALPCKNFFTSLRCPPPSEEQQAPDERAERARPTLVRADAELGCDALRGFARAGRIVARERDQQARCLFVTAGLNELAL